MIEKEIIINFENFLKNGEITFKELNESILSTLINLYYVGVYYIDNYKKYIYFSDDYKFLYLLNREVSNQNTLLFSRESIFYKNEISILINNQCNLSCDYCFSKKGAEKLTFEKLKPFLDFFININRFEEKISVFFSGIGEPLLEINTIKEIVEYLDFNFSHTKKDYEILTNLTLLNEEIISFFKKYNFRIVGSYDGSGFSENRIKNNIFLENHIIENIRRIQEYNLELKINLVVTKKHILNKEKLYEVLKDLISIENVSFLYILRNNYNRNYLREYTLEEYYDFLKFFMRKRYENFVFIKNFQDFFKLSLLPRVCNLGWRILPNGNVVSCANPFFRSVLDIDDRNNHYYIFNLNELNEITKLNQSSLLKYNKMFSDNSKKCSTCFYKPFCKNCIPMLLTSSDIICLNRELFKEILGEFLLRFIFKNKNQTN